MLAAILAAVTIPALAIALTAPRRYRREPERRSPKPTGPPARTRIPHSPSGLGARPGRRGPDPRPYRLRAAGPPHRHDSPHHGPHRTRRPDDRGPRCHPRPVQPGDRGVDRGRHGPRHPHPPPGRRHHRPLGHTALRSALRPPQRPRHDSLRSRALRCSHSRLNSGRLPGVVRSACRPRGGVRDRGHGDIRTRKGMILIIEADDLGTVSVTSVCTGFRMPDGPSGKSAFGQHESPRDPGRSSQQAPLLRDTPDRKLSSATGAIFRTNIVRRVPVYSRDRP